MPTYKSQQLSAEMQQCINDCLDCHATCLETITYCTQKGGKHVEATHLGLLRDCAEICQTGANLMCCGSNIHVASVRSVPKCASSAPRAAISLAATPR